MIADRLQVMVEVRYQHCGRDKYRNEIDSAPLLMFWCRVDIYPRVNGRHTSDDYKSFESWRRLFSGFHLASKVTKLHNLICRGYVASNEGSLYTSKSGEARRHLRNDILRKVLRILAQNVLRRLNMEIEVHRQKVGETIRQEKFSSGAG
jgi:hypothetical protein